MVCSALHCCDHHAQSLRFVINSAAEAVLGKGPIRMQDAVCSTAADRRAKNIWTASNLQCSTAKIVGEKDLQKFSHRNVVLELYAIHGHDAG